MTLRAPARHFPGQLPPDWELLRAHLSPEQWQNLRRVGWFEEPSRLYPGAVYRVWESTVENVRLRWRGQEVQRYCIESRRSITLPDLLLAEVLWLRGDEEGFRATAKAYGLLPPMLEARRRTRWARRRSRG